MNKIIKTLSAVTLAAALVGCGGSTGGSASEDKSIVVGATPSPHAEILENVVKDVLAEDGWTLKTVVFQDYVQPNEQLESGDLDANYYQTLGYMNNANTENGYHLTAVAGVHIEPMGFYSEKITALTDLEDGATIAVPNDSDNEDRGLRFLIQLGVLNDPKKDDLLKDTDFNGNADVNPHNYNITVAEAASLPHILPDVDGAVINGNYALEAGLPEKNPAIEIESFDSETTIARTNFIVVKEDNKDSAKTEALVKAITSDKVQQYIEDTYKGSVITSIIDENGKALN